MRRFVFLGGTRLRGRYGSAPAVSRRGFSVRDAQMESISFAVYKASGSIVDGLETQGWAVVDGLLDENLCKEMRGEAVELFEEGLFETSQTTRRDKKSNAFISYDKRNVFSLNLDCGETHLSLAPTLHNYIWAMTSTLQPILAERFPEAQLSSTMMRPSNKLSVCTGDGSKYEKHYDNSGLGDPRKVTVLYYMNNWRPEMEGQFRIYQAASHSSSDGQASSDRPEATTIDIDPVGNRLLVFWSDRLVHGVQESVAPAGSADHRHALTLWLTCVTPDAIYRNEAEDLEHFGIL